MAKSRSRCLVEKSVAAMMAAIEIYNKPDFHFREETFSIYNTILSYIISLPHV